MSKVIKGGSEPMQSKDANSGRMHPTSGPGTPSKLGPSKGPPIIQREMVDAGREAKRIIQAAQREAEAIIQAARREAREEQQRGYDDGYQEGLATYTEKTTQGILELRKKEAALEGEFIKLVRVCVERVIGQELQLNPGAVVGIVRSALQDARQQREIIVRVHPDDAERVRSEQRRLLEVLARANGIEVREDKTVSRGGCMILTELGTIDASLERQLAALQAAVDEEFREGTDGAYPAGHDELDQEDDPGAGGY